MNNSKHEFSLFQSKKNLRNEIKELKNDFYEAVESIGHYRNLLNDLENTLNQKGCLSDLEQKYWAVLHEGIQTLNIDLKDVDLLYQIEQKEVEIQGIGITGTK